MTLSQLNLGIKLKMLYWTWKTYLNNPNYLKGFLKSIKLNANTNEESIDESMAGIEQSEELEFQCFESTTLISSPYATNHIMGRIQLKRRNRRNEKPCVEFFLGHNPYKNFIEALACLFQSEKPSTIADDGIYERSDVGSPQNEESLSAIREINDTIVNFVENDRQVRTNEWTTVVSSRSPKSCDSNKKEFITIKDSADPFLFELEETTMLVLEKIVDGKGVIATFKIGENLDIELQSILQESFHLSFPRIVNFETMTILSVESSSEKGVRLYVYDSKKKSWRYLKTLRIREHVKDPIIVRMDDDWFLIANPVKKQGRFLDEVVVYRSSDLMSSSWQRLRNLSPVISPIGTRNGGFFEWHDCYIRISQINEPHIYGSGVRLSKLEKSKKNDTIVLSETLLENIKRKEFKQFHTINLTSKYLTFDFKY